MRGRGRRAGGDAARRPLERLRTTTDSPLALPLALAATAAALPISLATGSDVPLTVVGALGGFALGIVRASRTVALLALAVAVAGVIAVSDALGEASIVPYVLMTGTAWGAARALRANDAVASRLAERARELESERELYAELSVRYERARIAAELHDIVGHSLSVMVVQAAAGQRLLDHDPAAVADALDAIAESARQGQDDLGRLVDLLGGEPSVAPDLSLIDELVRRAARSGLRVSCRFEGDGDVSSALVAQVAFRVVQEALTNAIRYAPGSSVRVLVRHEGGRLSVSVTNDAPSGPVSGIVGGGEGLHGLRERVQQLGGGLAAGPAEAGGWSVAAWLPAV